jgi:amidase
LQVNLPIAYVEGLPVGLGLLGPPGSDEDLLELTEKLMEVLA